MSKQRLKLLKSNFSFSNEWEGATLYGDHKPSAGGFIVTFPHPVGQENKSTTWFFSYEQVYLLTPLEYAAKPRYTIANGVIALVVRVDLTDKVNVLEQCEGCAFKLRDECATAPPCNAGARHDRKNVIFITDIAKQFSALSGGLS
jgi:hypothetical protein